MVVLTVGLVSLAEMLAVTLRLQQLGRNEMHAVRLAQDKLDQLMSLEFTDPLISVAGSLTSNVANHFDTQAGPDGTLGTADDISAMAGYTRRWVLAAHPDSANLRNITIRVIPDVKDNRTASTYDLVSIIRDW